MQNFKFQVPDGELESIWLAGVVLLCFAMCSQ